jgi:hypothetical protein
MIRFIFGFLIVFGCVGAMDTAPDEDMFLLLGITIVGLVIMYQGTKSMKES